MEMEDGLNKGLIRALGHENGTNRLKPLLKLCAKLGIKTLHFTHFQLKMESSKIRSRDLNEVVSLFFKERN